MNQGLEEMLAQKEASDLLGISDRTMRRLRSQGIGPASYSIGKRYYYKRKDVEAWLERQNIEPEARNEKAPLTAISEANRNVETRSQNANR